MTDNLKSTKFITSMVCLVMVFVAFMLNKLSGTEFMPFILGILGIYTTGNVAAKIVDSTSAN